MGVYPYDGPFVSFTFAKQLTTDNWVTLDEVKNVRHTAQKTIRVLNENANNNSIDYRILGSLDDGENYDVTIKSSSSVGAGSSEVTNISEAVSHIKVEVKATAGGSQDEVSAKMGAINPQDQ